MLTFAFSILLTLAPQQEARLDIACPIGEIDADNKIARYSNGCIVDYEDMHFESDWFTYDRTTGVVTAGDHVHFKRGSEEIDGTHLEMNIKTKAGTIWDAKGKVDPGFHVTAKVAERFSDQSWEFHNTTITACESVKPCWTIVLGRAWYRQGEWIRGRNAIFRFHGVPIVPLPYVVAPSEHKDRATGFLIPSITSSNSKGRGYSEQFFWAINDSADASFMGQYFDKRGPAGEVSFRAKPTASGWVSVTTFFAKDRLLQGGHSLRVLAYTNVGKYSRAVVDLETESSETFRQVWGQSFNVIASPINRSVGYFTTNTPNYSTNFLYSRAEYLHTAPSTTLRKFPSFEASLPLREFSEKLPLYFKLDSSVSSLSRSDAVIATPTFGGRFDVHPAVQMPILRRNAFELSQEAGVRDTGYYHLSQPGVQERVINRFVLDYAARFSGPTFEKSYGKWRHSIQPTVDYRYVSGADRLRDNVIIDEVDMLADTSEVEYGITNRVLGSREALIWRVAQTAYFKPDFGGAIQDGQRNVFAPLMGLTGFSFAQGSRKFSPIVSTFGVQPNASNGFGVQVDYDTQLHRVRSSGVATVLRKGKLASSVLYAFTRATELQAANNQVRGNVSYGAATGRGFSISTTTSYDVREKLFQGATTLVSYNAECYGVSFELTGFNLGARQEHKWSFAFNLKNIGSFGTLQQPGRLF